MKKLFAMILAAAMCLSLCVPALALESTPTFTGPYAELKTSIYRQLEAQNKLEHFDLQLAAIIPQELGTSAKSRSATTWNAPNGGVLCYTYDWTYRDEDGYVENVTTYMTPSVTNAYLADDFGTLYALIAGVVSNGLSGLSTISPFITTVGIIGLAEDWLVKQSINNADRYGKLSVVYDSISGGTSTVLVGWDTHPTASLNWPSAYDVSFTFGS